MSEQTNTGVPKAPKEETIREARRRFLNECGRFAIATPPAVAAAGGIGTQVRGRPFGQSEQLALSSARRTFRVRPAPVASVSAKFPFGAEALFPEANGAAPRWP